MRRDCSQTAIGDQELVACVVGEVGGRSPYAVQPVYGTSQKFSTNSKDDEGFTGGLDAGLPAKSSLTATIAG